MTRMSGHPSLRSSRVFRLMPDTEAHLSTERCHNGDLYLLASEAVSGPVSIKEALWRSTTWRSNTRKLWCSTSSDERYVHCCRSNLVVSLPNNTANPDSRLSTNISCCLCDFRYCTMRQENRLEIGCEAGSSTSG